MVHFITALFIRIVFIIVVFKTVGCGTEVETPDAEITPTVVVDKPVAEKTEAPKEHHELNPEFYDWSDWKQPEIPEPEPTPEPVYDPIDYELMAERKAYLEQAFVERFDYLSTWTAGMDILALGLTDRRKGTFHATNDLNSYMIGTYESAEDLERWRKDVVSTNTNKEQTFCGEQGVYYDVSHTGFKMVFADQTEAFLSIEYAVSCNEQDECSLKFLRVQSKNTSEDTYQEHYQEDCAD